MKNKELLNIEQMISSNLEYSDEFGNSLLHLAVKTQNLEIVQKVSKAFINQKKSLAIINKENRTAMDLAEDLGLIDIYFWLNKPDIDLYLQKDHIGEFYKNLRLEGENTYCLCAIYDKETNKDIVNLNYLHEKYGGWRLLEYCFKKAGLKSVFSQSKLKKKNLIYYFLSLFNLFRSVFTKVLKKYSWKINHNTSNRTEIRRNLIQVTENNTEKFLQGCKNKKELFYTTLIKICNDVLTQNLLNKPEETHWLLTMPNQYKSKEKPYSYNDFAFLPFSVHPQDTPINVKKKIGTEYFLLSYLKVLWEIKIFNFLYKRYPNFIRKKMRNGENRFATFSFFGKKNYEKNVGLFGATNANCFSAVTIVCIIENNKLVLSLDVHPSYVNSNEDIDRIMNEIQTKVENYA